MQRGRFLLAAAAVLSAFCVGGAVSTSYFYSPTGDDAAKGTSAETAWKSLNHSVSLVPGACGAKLCVCMCIVVCYVVVGRSRDM